MRRGVIWAALAALLLGVSPAFPQPTVKPCVTVSAGLSGCPPVSASNPLPISGTITATASGTQDTNITQILGAAPSATNPLWVSPATASTPWIVTGSGTAGSAAVGVLSVQGIASGTALSVSSGSSATGGATYARVAPGTATTVIKASAGTLYAVCLNSAATATNVTTVYDNPSTSGTVIAVPAATTATVPTCLQYGPAGIAFVNGLTVITTIANGGDMTFSFK